MADERTIRGKIDRFNRDVLLPTYGEIQQSLSKRGDETTILKYGSEAIATTGGMVQVMNAQFSGLAFLFAHFPNDDEIAEGEEEYVGHSLYVVRNAAVKTGDYEGKFLISNRFRLAPGDQVYASPHVIYYMVFNDRLHVFNHRYDVELADHRVEDVTREHILNHFLDSYDFFKLHAKDPEPPW